VGRRAQSGVRVMVCAVTAVMAAPARRCAGRRARGLRARCDGTLVAGEGMRGHVGQQARARDRRSDQHPVDGAEAPEPGVAPGQRRCSRVAAHDN
jgi:hypothetical protein